MNDETPTQPTAVLMPDDAKDRLEEAMRTIRAMKASPHTWPRQHGSSWPDYVQSAWEASVEPTGVPVFRKCRQCGRKFEPVSMLDEMCPDHAREGAKKALADWEDETGAADSPYKDTEVEPARPSSHKISRMDETIWWVEMVGDGKEIDRLVTLFYHSFATAERVVIQRRMLLLARGARVSWSKLERRFYVSPRTLGRRHDDALENLCRRVNLENGHDANAAFRRGT